MNTTQQLEQEALTLAHEGLTPEAIEKHLGREFIMYKDAITEEYIESCWILTDQHESEEDIPAYDILDLQN